MEISLQEQTGNNTEKGKKLLRNLSNLIADEVNNLAWLPSRAEKKQYIIELYKQNRQVAKLMHMSFRDIGTIINKLNEKTGWHFLPRRPEELIR
ncbi:MAG: hypothetical protein WAM14_04505 [Candidatus Nitrosopolaris sp.]